MNKDQKARKALQWDKKEVYEADAKRLIAIMKKRSKRVLKESNS